MALSEGTQDSYRLSRGPKKRVPVTDGVNIFKGAVIMGLASGFAAPASTFTAAGAKIRGIALEDVDNTTGSAGDKDVELDVGGASVKLLTDVQASGEQGIVGDSVNIDSDNSCFLSGAGATSILVGQISEYLSGTVFGTNEIWVRLKPEGVAS